MVAYYKGRALYGQRPSRRNTTPTETENAGNDYDEQQEADERRRYAEAWADYHSDDAEDW